MAKEIADLLKRCKAAWAKKSTFDEIYRQAFKYGMPQRNRYDTPQPGAQKGSEVFDSTAAIGVTRFVNRLQTDLCPAFQKWVMCEAGPWVKKDERKQVNEILQQVSDRMATVIDTSNFQTEFGEFAGDLVAGTALMWVLEDKSLARTSPVLHQAAALIDYAIEEGPRGTVEGVWFNETVTAREIEKTWRDAKLNDNLATKAKDQPDEEIQFRVCCYYDDESGMWLYDVIYEVDQVSILKRPRKYQEQPFVCVRWSKSSNESYGRGPLVTALADIKTLNKLVELILKNASIAVSGVYTVVNDGVTNPATIRVVPGAFIPVSSNGGTRGPSIAPLKPAAAFDIAQIEMQELKEVIQKLLYDNRLPSDQGPVRSATEIAARLKDLAADLGAAFGRIMNEFVLPYVRRVIGIMTRAGLFSDLAGAERGIDVNGYIVQAKVTSPLARLQNAADVDAVVQWLSLVAGTVGPEMMALGIKIEDLPQWLGEKLGVPADLIRDQGEKGDIQKNVVQFIAQAQMQQQQQGAEPPSSQPANTPMAA